jgi:hypothetical protein
MKENFRFRPDWEFPLLTIAAQIISGLYIFRERQTKTNTDAASLKYYYYYYYCSNFVAAVSMTIYRVEREN